MESGLPLNCIQKRIQDYENKAIFGFAWESSRHAGGASPNRRPCRSLPIYKGKPGACIVTSALIPFMGIRMNISHYYLDPAVLLGYI
jgi:hypothetical protein